MIANYYITLPSSTEQKEIADYLDAKCAEIDKLIAKKEQLVKELESYKKSLIYEVVTGKTGGVKCGSVNVNFKSLREKLSKR